MHDQRVELEASGSSDGESVFLVELTQRRHHCLVLTLELHAQQVADVDVFDDLVGTQQTINQSAPDDNVITSWITFSRFFIDEKILDPTLTKDQALNLFYTELSSGATRKRKINGEWCLAENSGGQTIDRATHGAQSSLTRSVETR
jgi:hypothetical protein